MNSNQAMDHHWRLVEAIEGPRLSIPVSLVAALGDLRIAAFLQQAAFLSSVARQSGGWFFLAQTGPADSAGASLFGKLGSWQAALGISPDSQLAIRRKLIALGLLDEALRGVPARLHYRVDPKKYLDFLGGIAPPQAPGEPGNKFPGFPETGFGETGNLDSGKSRNYRSKERNEESKQEMNKKEREIAQPNAAALPAARDAQPLSEDSYFGISFFPGNKEDVAKIDRIKREFSRNDICQAAEQAKRLDPRERAWPTAVLRILLSQQSRSSPSRLGVRDGSRVADLAVVQSDQPKDMRAIKFPGGIYLFGDDAVIVDRYLQDAGFQFDLLPYIEADQIALVDSESDLPERVRLKYKGVSTGKMVPVHVPIGHDELPDFTSAPKWRGMDRDSVTPTDQP